MKRMFIMAACIIGFAACQQSEDMTIDDVQTSSKKVKIGMLSFSSTDDLLAAMDLMPEDGSKLPASIATRVGDDSDEMLDLFDPLDDLPIDEDPILKIDCKPIVGKALIDNGDLTLYEARGYDTLIPNIRLAKLLNARAELMIDTTIYKISSRGTYYYPESKKAYFEEHYEQFESEDGIQIDSCVYRMADDILRYSTFELSDSVDYEADDLPDEIEGDPTIDDDEEVVEDDSEEEYDGEEEVVVGTRALAAVPIDWTKYPVYNADAKTWVGKIWQSLFGRNKAYTYKLSKKRRLKAKFYYFNYVFVSQIGAMGEMQKKNWIGWSETNADELYIGWQNIILYSDYAVKPDASLYPKNPKGTIVGSEYMQIPGFNRKGHVLSIMGIDLTQSQINSIIKMGTKQLFNWLKSQLSNSDKLYQSEFDTIMFYTPTKVITVIPDGAFYATNMSKHKEVFAEDVHVLISFNLAKFPSSASSWMKWAENIRKKSSSLSRPELKYGEVRVAGRLGNTWGAVRIQKK